MGAYTTGYQGFLNPAKEAIIQSGETDSDPITMGGFTLCGIKMPSSFTGTSVTFKACDTIDGDYLDVYNSTSILSYAVGVDRFVSVDPKDFQGILFLKIISSGAEAGDRSLFLAVKGF